MCDSENKENKEIKLKNRFYEIDTDSNDSNSDLEYDYNFKSESELNNDYFVKTTEIIFKNLREYIEEKSLPIGEQLKFHILQNFLESKL